MDANLYRYNLYMGCVVASPALRDPVASLSQIRESVDGSHTPYLVEWSLFLESCRIRAYWRQAATVPSECPPSRTQALISAVNLATSVSAARLAVSSRRVAYDQCLSPCRLAVQVLSQRCHVLLKGVHNLEQAVNVVNGGQWRRWLVLRVSKLRVSE